MLLSQAEAAKETDATQGSMESEHFSLDLKDKPSCPSEKSQAPNAPAPRVEINEKVQSKLRQESEKNRQDGNETNREVMELLARCTELKLIDEVSTAFSLPKQI